MEEAQKKALDAAGLKQEEVIFKPTGEEFDDGREIIDVDFFVPGEVKYEFDIDAATGAILEQDFDLWEAEDDFEYAALIEAAKNGTNSVAAEAAKTEAGRITELQAKAIAMKDAGLTPEACTFTECKLEMDDGIEKYEIEIRLADGSEYSFDINAADGTILEKEFDND